MIIEHLISYLSQVKGYLEGGEKKLVTYPIDEIIKLLKEGKENEKYKKMWYGTRDKFVYIEQMNFPIKRYTYENIMSVMNEIKQKYFPELIKKTIKIEIEAKDIDGMAFGIKTIGHIISDISGNKNIPKMKIIDIGKMKVDKE